MRSLVIDAGNKFVKFAIYDNDTLVSLKALPVNHAFDHKIEGCTAAIFSTVSVEPETMITWLGLMKIAKIVALNSDTKLPYSSNYTTPSTLGNDRRAVVAGAFYLYSKMDILIINMGTCITFDLLTSVGQHEGGRISPGYDMRFKAMHSFTKKLPLLTGNDKPSLIGLSTDESMQAGVFYGIVGEIDSLIDNLKQQYSQLKVLITGGNAKAFEKSIKNEIHLHQNLAIEGLFKILHAHE